MKSEQSFQLLVSYNKCHDLCEGLSEEAISYLEKSNSITLPSELKSLYRVFDGGEIFIPGTLIYGINQSSKRKTLREANSKVSRGNYTIPSNYLVVAKLNFGDLICINLGTFWFLTLFIALGIQALVQSIWGNEIITSIFGDGYGSGIESLGTNLAIWLGPWGFVICGLIGTLIYNCRWSTGGSLYGYKWYHYVLSVLTSVGCSALYILLIFLITLAILLIALALGIAILIGLLSGS